MNRFLKDGVRLFICFVIGACIFSVCLHYIYREFEEIHRYDQPEGPALKVAKHELLERFPFAIWKGE